LKPGPAEDGGGAIIQFDHLAGTGSRPATLVDVLRARAQHQPRQVGYIFLVDGNTVEQRLTYGALDGQARAIAVTLQALGATGARALLLYPPGLAYIAAFFGCLYAGVVAVPAYPPLPGRWPRALPRLLAIAGDARPVVALTLSSMLPKIQALFASLADAPPMRWLATDTIGAQQADAWQPWGGNGNTLAFLQYTSGSTAAPKGVLLSHRNLLHNAALIQQYFEHTTDSWGVIWLPPYHDMGLIGGILQPLYAAFPVTLMAPRIMLQHPYRWLEAISRYKATTSGGPNFAYDLCVRRITPAQRASLDLSSWSVAFSGAEPIRHETLERFAAFFEPCGFRREAFYPCYGLAEATLMVSGGAKVARPIIYDACATALEQHHVIPGNRQHGAIRSLVGCGQSLAEQRIVIVDPQTLTQCLPEQIGEIWVAGPSVAQGYWNQPQETADTFLAQVADTGEGPFLRTGDLGFLRHGELFITGRHKELVIIAGRNQYPHDIEWTVERSHAALRPGGCAAFSVDIADQERLVVLAELQRWSHTAESHDALVPPPTQQSREPLPTSAVVRAIRQAIAQVHDVQVYAIALLKTGSIPKTSSGKIQRHACRALFLAGALDALAEWTTGLQAPEHSGQTHAPTENT
jgi:acyl-CoA synthetase (AMP-forming)/AMP-acid ligase II